jgi:hypothetical protein
LRKHGLILNLPLDAELEWSQGPQVLVMENCARVYFSTRRREGDYFYSDIAYFDYNLDLSSSQSHSSHTVIARGDLGSFDFDGIFPFHVFDSKGTSKQLFGFICGWKRKVAVDIDMSIGLAESIDNGYSFQRIGKGPILTSNINEPYLIGDPCVIQKDDQYLMFYISGRNWLKNTAGQLERQYSVMMATSSDLFHWNRNAQPIIPERLNFEAQAMPSVLLIDGTFHLMYCYRDVFDFRENALNSYRIGHAYSRDLINWKTSGFEIPIGSPGEWDSEMQCYPHLVEIDGRIFLLYNGNEFGKYGIGLIELTREELAEHAKF